MIHLRTSTQVFLAVLMAISIGRAEDHHPFQPLVPEKDGTIRIRAEGRAEAQAARAKVRLRVTSVAASLKDAIVRNGHHRKTLVHKLAPFGIREDAITAQRFSSLPDHPVSTGSTRSYRVTNIVEISITSEQQFLAIARVVDAFDAVQIVAREIDCDERTHVETEAAMAAYRSLMAKARLYEKAMGTKLELLSLAERQNDDGDGDGNPITARTRESSAARPSGPDGGGEGSRSAPIASRVSIEARFRFASADKPGRNVQDLQE